MIASKKNEEKVVNVSTFRPNDPLSARTESYITSPLAPASITPSEASTVIPANLTNKAVETIPNSNGVNFGKHPQGHEKQYIDIKDHISMLQKEKAMFLKTRVYNEQDPIVKQLNEKIEGLLSARDQLS